MLEGTFITVFKEKPQSKQVVNHSITRGECRRGGEKSKHVLMLSKQEGQPYGRQREATGKGEGK